MGMTELEKMVKWCILDAAYINGKHLSDCKGPVTKTVTYNNNKVTVNTSITNEDIDSYYAEKNVSTVCYA